MRRELAIEISRVTEAAALAAYKWVGRGDKNTADGAAVEAMRHILNQIDIDGEIVIGEGEIDEADFMDRARLLCSLGQTVMISNFQEYYKLVEYFSNYTKERMGLAMGVNNLIPIFDEKYYRHLSGGILEAFGKLFYRDLKVFLYPSLDENGVLINSENLKVHPRMKIII